MSRLPVKLADWIADCYPKAPLVFLPKKLYNWHTNIKEDEIVLIHTWTSAPKDANVNVTLRFQ